MLIVIIFILFFIIATMTFIGFLKKLNTSLFSKIVLKNDLFLLNGKEVLNCEFCGVLLDSNQRNLVFCDFYGKMEILKNSEIQPEGKGPYIFTVKLYSKKGNIYGYCKSIRKVTIYEEIAFNIEVKSLISTCCY